MPGMSDSHQDFSQPDEKKSAEEEISCVRWNMLCTFQHWTKRFSSAATVSLPGRLRGSLPMTLWTPEVRHHRFSRPAPYRAWLPRLIAIVFNWQH